jgi:hypothetical protein
MYVHVYPIRSSCLGTPLRQLSACVGKAYLLELWLWLGHTPTRARAYLLRRCGISTWRVHSQDLRGLESWRCAMRADI